MKKFFLLALLLLLLSAPAWGGDMYQRVDKAGDDLEEISKEATSNKSQILSDDESITDWGHEPELWGGVAEIVGSETLILPWPGSPITKIIISSPECDITYEICDGEIVLTGRLWK